MSEPCAWTEDSSGDFWQTDCGKLFTFTDGGPKDNGLVFCCYCGAPLTQVTALEAIPDDDDDPPLPDAAGDA
jgi:hypothetical protein